VSTPYSVQQRFACLTNWQFKNRSITFWIQILSRINHYQRLITFVTFWCNHALGLSSVEPVRCTSIKQRVDQNGLLLAGLFEFSLLSDALYSEFFFKIFRISFSLICICLPMWTSYAFPIDWMHLKTCKNFAEKCIFAKKFSKVFLKRGKAPSRTSSPTLLLHPLFRISGFATGVFCFSLTGFFFVA